MKIVTLLLLLTLLASCSMNKGATNKQRESVAISKLASGAVFERSNMGTTGVTVNFTEIENRVFLEKVDERIKKFSDEKPWCSDLVIPDESSASKEERVTLLMRCLGDAFFKERSLLNIDVDEERKKLSQERTDIIRNRGMLIDEKIDRLEKIEDEAGNIWIKIKDHYLTLSVKAYLALKPHMAIISSIPIDRYHLIAEVVAQFSTLSDNISESFLILRVNGSEMNLEAAQELRALYLFSFNSFLPDPNMELAELDKSENPFSSYWTYSRSLLPPGFDHIREHLQDEANMQKISDSIFPEIPANSNPVKLLIEDDGFDFVQVPELLFFSDKKLRVDIADNDDNVYLQTGKRDIDTLSFSHLTHGTAVAASALSLIAQLLPESLINNSIVLGLIKRISTFDLFNRSSDSIETLIELNPDIVSRSLVMPNFANSPDALKNSLKEINFLYVTGAGNDSTDVENGHANHSEILEGCFASFPEEYRPSDKIICVGALHKGVVWDEMASYTNFGKFVDLYTYESVHKYCNAGTSCATPAISAAAAMIKSKYPALTAAELKRVLVESAEIKEILNNKHNGSIDFEKWASATSKTIKVPIFDPYTMMDKAYKKAEKVLKERLLKG